MNAERWRTVKKILEEARELSPADRDDYLNKACGDDAGLRKEVESLVAHGEQAKEFLNRSPDGRNLEQAMALGSDTRLGPYQIEGSLGAGGMGEVYRAKDTRLGRTVAIEVLPAHLSGNAELRARFEREARAVSSLNHPHICTLYDIGRQDGVDFLVMEYLEGETLAERLERGALALDEALELAIQIAEALHKAHHEGVVHRDVKPGNIMLSPQGPKLLDFGLATLLPVSKSGLQESEPPTAIRPLTASNTVMGTFPYAAPEQLEGKEVDSRADIFAMGTVLYETVTGRRVFPGDSAASTIAAVLGHEPAPLSQLEPSTPPALEWVIQRCLAKNPDERWQSALDLSSQLRWIRSGNATSAAASAPEGSGALRSSREASAPSRTHSASAMRLAVLAVSALVAGYALRGMFSPDFGASVPRLANPVQITVAEGLEDFPSWSPDGRTVAFHSNVDGDFDIWIQQPGSGEALNRTADYPGADRFPTWSPSGNEIAFWSEREGGGYFVMSTLAGNPRRIAPQEGYGPPRWSSDGARVGFLSFDGSASSFSIVSVESGETESFRLHATRPPTMGATWNSNGNLVAYLDTNTTASSRHALKVANIRDGVEFFVTDGSTEIWSPIWSEDGYLYYISNRGGVLDLWRRAISDSGEPNGDAQPLTTGLGLRSIDLSSDGRKLAYSRGRRLHNIWRVPAGLGRRATWDDAEKLTFDQAIIDYIDVAPDGSLLLFDSDRSGNPDLWMMNLATRELTRLTSHPDQDFAPRLSPDGKEVAFYSTRSGNRDVWVAPFDGATRQLTDYEGLDCCPAWSPAGDELAYFSSRPTREVFRIPSSGGESRHVRTTVATVGILEWSIGGDFLTFHEQGRLWRVPVEGGPPQALTRGPDSDWQHRWSLDGRYIYVQGAGERTGNLWRYRVEDGVEEPFTDLSGRRGRLGELALATDDQYVYFTWEDDIGDIWIMDVVTE